MPTTRRTGGCRTAACVEAMLRCAGFADPAAPGGGGLRLPPRRGAGRRRRGLSGAREQGMIEAAMIWNEPNNKSHWDPELDPGLEPLRRDGDRRRAGDPGRERRACRACSAASRRSIRSSSGNMADTRRARPRRRGRRARLPARLEPLADPRMAGEDRRDPRRHRPADLGHARSASPPSAPRRCRSGACERTAELLIGRAPRIHWYSLYDLPRAWEATTRHREAEGSSYYRHFYMGLLREDGTPKPAAEALRQATRRSSASASGSTSRTTGSTTPSPG